MADQKRETYDVIVVGSGASGGWASKRLAEAGLKVELLEAGRPQSDKNFSEHKPRFELKYRNLAPEIVRKTRPIQMKFGVCNEYTYDWFVNDLEEPYTTPSDKPFNWMGRLRITGGRTNVWGRVSLRFSEWDFRAASVDGYGENWPLGYKDVESYYDLVEKYVGITGSAEGLEHLPDGRFQPPVSLTCQETLFRNRVKEKLGRTVMPSRTANRARGVLYIDRNTRQAREVYARVVILCAQSQESVRILFNSATPQYPKGLANSSGVLGHYLTAHVRSAGGSGEFPSFGAKPSLGGPHKPVGIYIARFRNLPNAPPYKKFIRGYGYEGESTMRFNWGAPGFGEAYKKALLEPRSSIAITGFGEVLPRWDNFVELDPNVKDIYGIPVLKIHMSDGENERAMIQDMGDSAGEMLEAAGAKNIRTYAHPSAPRWALHEAGIARMGADPKKSVLNQFQQTHDIKNLFVMDASGFPSNPCQNPTLTIMALCVRSCDYLMAELKRNSL